MHAPSPCASGWAVGDAALWGLLWLAEACIQPVSRRLCNLTFIIWVCAFCGALALPLLVSQVCDGVATDSPPWIRKFSLYKSACCWKPPAGLGALARCAGSVAVDAIMLDFLPQCPQVLLPYGLQPWLPAAFNRNMLPLFLVANLATGVVNLGMDTLSASGHVSRAVVSTYAALVCGLAALLDARGIRINLKTLKSK